MPPVLASGSLREVSVVLLCCCCFSAPHPPPPPPAATPPLVIGGAAAVPAAASLIAVGQPFAAGMIIGNHIIQPAPRQSLDNMCYKAACATSPAGGCTAAPPAGSSNRVHLKTDDLVVPCVNVTNRTACGDRCLPLRLADIKPRSHEVTAYHSESLRSLTTRLSVHASLVPHCSESVM